METNAIIVLGIFMLTSDQFVELREKVEYKNETITTGFKLFNDCFPQDFQLINEVVNGKKLVDIFV